MLNIEIGDIVVSIAGRDMGNSYIVKQITNGKVYLVDGKGKSILKPKIKNIKHIKPLNDKNDDLKSKFLSDKRVLDSEIRKILNNF